METLEDCPDARAIINDLETREELCRAVAEESPAMLWMGDENGKCVFLNQALRDFWGVDPEDLSTFDWGSTVHPDDLEKLRGPFAKAMAEQVPFTVEARYRRADGVYRTLLTQARPRFDRRQRFLGMSGVNIDITEKLFAEERMRILMGELNHRTKNILSIVQAVARQTARHVTPEEFSRAFDDRLRGLAANNDILVRNDWKGVAFDDLVRAQLAYIRDLIGVRIILEGPRLWIPASAAQTLGMALHELSTNSLKYGALAVETGRVDLTWQRHPASSAPGFTLSWVESGLSGVSPPSRKGFGHVVIVDMVAAALDADVDVKFDADGFKWLVAARSDGSIAPPDGFGSQADPSADPWPFPD
ncbi:sensor histidine kinase [Roseibium salinum]|uniref:Blue-light-activated histidine kinase n=1 Tax=Roseibium salinum TaxID=1604349 RepID=A0ABT3R5A1_9HYPH|nr:HWE histidine kinase domain-containing protein [Roseibium sp. DSM 29163]MCX2724334.1 PAS domain S-box protein [Roseibium sp. DSM 29163]